MLTLYRRPQPSALRRDFSSDAFSQMVDRFFHDFAPAVEGATTPSARSWVPAMDLVETDDAFVATTDLPGLKKDDIKISLDEGVLSISGERTFKTETEGEEGSGFRRFERAFGSFHRSFNLPQGVDAENVGAAFEDGVLTVTLPKQEGAKSRTISIS